MPYQSGTASSFADLQSKIETFLTGTPGMTLTSGVLTKSGTDIHVKFSNSASHIGLDIGKGSSAGSLLHMHPPHTAGDATVAMVDQYYDTTISIVFPINYEFFYFSSPVNEFRCVIEYNNGYTQNIGFGEINKAVDLFGGVYIDGSACRRSDGGFGNVTISSMGWDVAILPAAGTTIRRTHSSPLPFGYGRDGIVDYVSSSYLWAECNGFGWWQTGDINCSSAVWTGTDYARGLYTNDHPLQVNEMVMPLAENSLQTYNANNALVKIPLWGRAPSRNLFRIGGVENIRWTNIKHRNFGEIATIGPDKWKHYPAFFKDGSVQDGTGTHSGQIGFAVRYDGP